PLKSVFSTSMMRAKLSPAHWHEKQWAYCLSTLRLIDGLSSEWKTQLILTRPWPGSGMARSKYFSITSTIGGFSPSLFRLLRARLVFMSVAVRHCRAESRFVLPPAGCGVRVFGEDGGVFCVLLVDAVHNLPQVARVHVLWSAEGCERTFDTFRVIECSDSVAESCREPPRVVVFPNLSNLVNSVGCGPEFLDDLAHLSPLKSS